MSPRRSYTSYLDRIREQQRLLSFTILHFDPASRDIQLWFWYAVVGRHAAAAVDLPFCILRPITQEGTRVTPPDFDSYRSKHNFRAPCCLCGSDTSRNGYTESAIYVPLTGQYVGEYVAGCAYNRCGYLVPMERMYTRRGLLLERYPLRRPGELAPPTVHLLPASQRLFKTILERLGGPRKPVVSVTDAMYSRGGSIRAERRRGPAMKRRASKYHTGSTAGALVVIDVTRDDVPIVIDLIGDSDDD